MLRQNAADPGNNFTQAMQYLIDHGQEWDYVVGVPFSYVSYFAEDFSVPVDTGINMGWNYLDGLYSLALGIQQLFNTTGDYRQKSMKVKGLLNLVGGLQAFAFSYNPALSAAVGLAGGAAIGGPSFMLGMACDLVTSIIDLCNAQKEVDITSWFQERAQELKYYNEKIEDIEIRLRNAKKNANRDFLGSIPRLEKRLALFKAKEKITLENLCKRARVHCSAAESYNGAEKELINLIQQGGYTVSSEQLRSNSEGNEIINEQGIYLDHNVKKTEKEWNDDFQKSLEKARNEQIYSLVLRTVSFVGMTLLAIAPFVVCPYLVPIGLGIVSLVMVAYLCRNSYNIGAKVASKLDEWGLFSPKNKVNKNQVNKNKVESASPADSLLSAESSIKPAIL